MVQPYLEVIVFWVPVVFLIKTSRAYFLVNVYRLVCNDPSSGLKNLYVVKDHSEHHCSVQVKHLLILLASFAGQC